MQYKSSAHERLNVKTQRKAYPKIKWVDHIMAFLRGAPVIYIGRLDAIPKMARNVSYCVARK